MVCQSDSPTSTKSFACDDCTRRFLNAVSLKQHQESAHGGSQPDGHYLCTSCSKVFMSTISLDQHFAYKHTPIATLVAQKYICRCNRMFQSFEALGAHHRSANFHREESAVSGSHTSTATPSNASYMCICLEKFDHFNDLRDHYRSDHPSEAPPISTTAINPWPCEGCLRSFRSKYDLLKHTVSRLATSAS